MSSNSPRGCNTTTSPPTWISTNRSRSRPGRLPPSMPTIRSIAGETLLPTSSTRSMRSARRRAKVADQGRPHADPNEAKPPRLRRFRFHRRIEAGQDRLSELKAGAGELLSDGHRAALQPQSIRARRVQAIRQHPAEPDRDDQAAGEGLDVRVPAAGKASQQQSCWSRLSAPAARSRRLIIPTRCAYRSSRTTASSG